MRSLSSNQTIQIEKELMIDSILKPLTLLCFLVVLQGCGRGNDGPEMASVKGTVKIDGAPVPKGDIIFEPADGMGRAAAGVIENGVFEFTSPVGSKKIMIHASRKTGKKGKDFGEDLMESYIPKKYNSESELKENVAPGSENEFEFDLKSK